ncbi:MAG TPA: hypothetical protein VF170_18960, partial [Planctomycetaceae bacterium]
MSFPWHSRLAAAVVVLAVSPIFAQLPQTRLGVVFPPGGQAGTAFEVRVSGEQDLDYEAAPRLLFGHPGVTAEAVVDPATGAWQNNAFRVTVAPDVPPGRYDVMLAGYYGASNPRSFRVDATASQAEAADVPPATPVPLAADAPFYGRIESAADVDAFTFAGEAGRTVLLRCEAALLDSPLHPVLELVGPDGRRLGSTGGPFRGEAALPVVLPTSGEYRVRLADASFRGGPDFLYRLEIATRPVVAAVWPPCGEPGTTMEYVLLGYNLPGGEPVAPGGPLVRRKATITLPREYDASPTAGVVPSHQAGVDGFDYVFREGDLAADPVPIFAVPRPPEQEWEYAGPTGPPAVIPMETVGRFETPGDADRYVLELKAGQVVYLEVFAKRYGSPADPVLTVDQVIGPDGQPKERRLATDDDRTESVAPNVFDTATDDPLLRFEAPEDGRYRVTVRDRYSSSRGDETLFYRLSIRPPQPDFRLVVVPALRDKPDGPASPGAVSLRKGENAAVIVYALRRDGFDRPIRVRADGLPPGVSTAGVTIGAGQASAPLVLAVSDDAAAWQGPVTVVGESEIDPAAGTVTRTACVGTLIRGGANQPAEARLAGPLVVSVLDEGMPFRLAGEGGAVRVGQGSQVLVPLRLTRKDGYAEPIALAAEGLPGDAKVAPEAKPFDGMVSEQFARLVVDPQAPPRSYAVLFKGTAKIDVAKFPHRLRRAKAAQEAAAAAFARSEEALKQATATRDEAATAVQAAEAALQAAAEDAKPQATATVEAAKATLAER